MALAKVDHVMIAQKFSVVLERTTRELVGISCLQLDDPDPPKQEICCSRMFGKRLSEPGPIKEAVATYTARAAENIRAQRSMCKKMRISLRTGMFNPDEAKYANGVLVELPYPTNDTLLMTNAAIQAVVHVFRPGCRYSKAEVLLLDLRQPSEYTGDLLAQTQPEMREQLMKVMDTINGRWGRGTLRTASVPTKPDWAMRRDLMSQSYTTRIDQLWTAKCN